MIKPKEIHIVFNELSGSGKGQLICQTLVKEVKEKKLSFSLHKSCYAGHTVKIVAELVQELNALLSSATAILLIVGGDGTLHEALLGLGETYKHIPLAYIPAGSGNDFAKGLGISKNTSKALEQILSVKTPREVNVIQFKENNKKQIRYAVNNVGVGFDASTVKQANQSTVKARLNRYHLGSLTYLISVITVLSQQKAFPIEVVTDHQKLSFPKAFLVTVNNHPYFGGGIRISPKASPYDNKVDLIVLEKSSVFKIIWLFLLLLADGRHLKHKDVHYIKTENLRMYSAVREEVQADGELLGYRTIDLQLSSSSRYFWF